MHADSHKWSKIVHTNLSIQNAITNVILLAVCSSIIWYLTDIHMIQPRGYIVDFHIVTFPVAHIHHRCDIIACAWGSNWHVKCVLVGGWSGRDIRRFSQESAGLNQWQMCWRELLQAQANYNCKSVSIKHYFRAWKPNN